MLKLLLSTTLLFQFAVSFAQSTELNKFFVLGGVNALVFTKDPTNLSTAINYSLHLGATRFPVRFMVKAGFPGYQPQLTSYLTYKYNVTGMYWQPGLAIYVKDLKPKQPVGFFLGVSGYFGNYNHDLKITLSDPTWNTSKTYAFNGDAKVTGFVVEATTLITVYKWVIASMSFHSGAAKIDRNPFPGIRNFEEGVYIFPGLGTGNKEASQTRSFLNMTIGVHFLLL